MKKPEIRIHFAWLLYDNVSRDMFEKYAGKTDEFPTYEACETYVANYRKEWETYEDTVIAAIQSAIGVSFYQPVIDAACAPWVSIQSDPLIFNFYNEPDQFVDVLTHELCHILLTDNNVYSIKSSRQPIDLIERWGRLFGTEHDFTTLVHIPVHALCQYIYLDVFRQPERLGRDIKDVESNPPYKAAWEYVSAHGYRHIIEQIKLDFEQLRRG